MSDESYDMVYKIVLVGNECVGKSSLLSIFCQKFSLLNYRPTIGVNFDTKTIGIATDSQTAILGEATQPGKPVQEYSDLLTQARLSWHFTLIFTGWLDCSARIAPKMTKYKVCRRRQLRSQ